MKKLIFFRRFSQLLVVLLFCALPWLNLQGWQYASGTLFAFDLAGIPFADPASSVQATVLGGFAGAWPLFSYYIGGLIALAIAFILGRVFCGWLCPYGLFSELVHKVRGRRSRPLSAKKRKILFWSRAGIVVLCLLLAWLLRYPLMSILSMPGELSLVPLLATLGAGFALLISAVILPISALLCEFIVGRRIWCECICPQSFFLGIGAAALPQKAPGLVIGWDAGDCTCGADSPCQQACSMDLNPRHKNGPPRRDCLMCGDCVQECQKYGNALKFMVR